jgi:hypothetical protein
MANANSQINREHTKKYKEVVEKIKNRWKDKKISKMGEHYKAYKDAFNNERVVRVDKIPSHCPPLCVKCGKYFDKCLITGTKAVAVLHNQHTTYVEVFECSGCGAIVIGDNYKRCI